MSTRLQNYAQDGANYQARAVLAYLQSQEGIADSWNNERSRYDSEIEVARWENCREQGYIVSMLVEGQQINIAFFEHRNSDSICAIEWLQYSRNTLTIDTAEFGNVYKDKWDVSHEVGYGEAAKMAAWIWERLEDHWKKNAKPATEIKP